MGGPRPGGGGVLPIIWHGSVSPGSIETDDWWPQPSRPISYSENKNRAELSRSRVYLPRFDLFIIEIGFFVSSFWKLSYYTIKCFTAKLFLIFTKSFHYQLSQQRRLLFIISKHFPIFLQYNCKAQSLLQPGSIEDKEDFSKSIRSLELM